MFASMYIQMAKPYESLRSAHTFEYMPRTWTEVDEGEWRKERDAVSRTDAERLPNEEPSRSDAHLRLIFDEEKLKEVVIVLEKKFRQQIMQDHEDAGEAVSIQQDLDRLVRIEIERKKDFDHRFFAKRVPRCIPAPSVLIPRVKAVVGAFADLTDTKTKKPLFDDKARKKVDAFLEEIKLGHSLLRHAWHCVLQVQARQAQKGYKGRGRPRLA